jgi:hypothetical protein
MLGQGCLIDHHGWIVWDVELGVVTMRLGIVFFSVKMFDAIVKGHNNGAATNAITEFFKS